MFTSVQLFWVPVALALFSLLCEKLAFAWRRRRYCLAHGCKKPTFAPQRDPFFGFDIFMKCEKVIREKRFLDYVAKQFHNSGSTFKWNLMGDELVFTCEPQNLQAMLATSFGDFDLGAFRQKITKPFWGVGIFNSDGPFWAHSRALIRPNFTKEMVSDMSTYAHHVDKLISRLPTDGSTVDLQDLFFRLTLDTATEHLLGESTKTLEPDAPETVKRFASAFTYAQRAIVRRIRMGKFAWLDRDKEFDEACAYAHRYVKPLIQHALSREQALSAKKDDDRSPLQKSGGEPQKSRYSFIDELVKQETDPEKVQAQVMNILVAGRDSTASLLSSLFFTLSRRSDIFSKVQEEVAALQGRNPTYDDLKEMKYLNHTIRETLRLYPVLPFNTRVANKDTMLPLGGGPDGKSPIFICKGQMIIYQIYSMHRRQDLWGPDAEQFRPERWIDARPTFEYLPFSAGPRICPGQQYAVTEAAYTTVRLCQTFSKIEARDDGGPWTEFLTLTCAVGQNVNVAVTKRE